MEYLDISNTDWTRMWDELARYSLNRGDHLCVNQGHCWEYMGSTIDHHHFRHAHHPLSDRVEYAYVERVRAAVAWPEKKIVYA